MKRSFTDRKNKILQICLLFLCAAVGGLLSIYYGPDANWDLQNYHLYNPFHFLHNRLQDDFMAAGMQTYLNPILDLPYYYLSVEWFQGSPKVVAFIMGLPYGVVIFVCLLISNDISLSLPRPRKFEVFLAAAFGLTGTIVLSEVGTTFNDIQISIIVLLALLFELKAIDKENSKGIPSGVLLGLAAGLKITSAIFAPAMLMAILIASKSFRSGIRASFLFFFFWGVGFSISGGFSAYQLYETFGNPIFPFFNSVFHSSWYSLDSGRDARFMPKNLVEAVFYPFYWLAGKPTITELPMRDGRYAVAFISVTLYGLLYFANSLKPALINANSKVILKNSKILFVVSFFAISYIIWEMLFSIGRYAIPLEILTGLLFFIGYKLCYAQFGSQMSARVTVGVSTAVILVLILFTSLPMNWGRLQYTQSFSVPDFAASLKKFNGRLPLNSTVLVFGRPIAFIIPFIDSPGSAYFGLSDGVDALPASSPPFDMIRSRLRKNWPAFVLTNAEDAATRGSLSRISAFVFEPSRCEVLDSSFQNGIRLCPVHLVHD